ncbi:MAG: hypothetical protein P8Y70_10915 [Candidatus Lokiarchaeota archaeon]
MVDVKYRYCQVCKKEIEEPIRKPMDTMVKLVWVIFIIATVGIGLIIFLVYRFKIKPKNYCPICHSRLEISNKPFIEPEEELEAKTPKEKVLKKAGKTKEVKERRKIIKKENGSKKEINKKSDQQELAKPSKCPYCGNKIDKDVKDSLYCQFCGAKL